MQSTFKIERNTRQVRIWLALFMVALALSGITALPLEWELSNLRRFFDPSSAIGSWLDEVTLALHQTDKRYPFLFYGYDWLAFAHFILAFLFIGPYRDPVRNKWVVVFGIYACLFVIPFAIVAGQARGIPIEWRLIDCMFGVIGAIPLLICHNKINALELLINKNNEK